MHSAVEHPVIPEVREPRPVATKTSFPTLGAYPHASKALPKAMYASGNSLLPIWYRFSIGSPVSTSITVYRLRCILSM